MFVRKKAAAALGASLIALSAVTAMPADADVMSETALEEGDGNAWSNGLNACCVWPSSYHKKKRYSAAVERVRLRDPRCVARNKWLRPSAPHAWRGGNRACTTSVIWPKNPIFRIRGPQG